jgi:hypothetical protein
MLGWITNAIKSGASFLTNSAPPNIENKLEIERLEGVNHLESKKFFIVFTSVIILTFFFFASTAMLFFLPQKPEIITGFVTLFTKTSEILAVVIAAYVSVQAAVDFKINSSSSASVAGSSQNITQNSTQTITEDKNQTITQNINEQITIIHSNQKEDDYDIS